MDIFWLIFAHCLADFPLQGQWLAEYKGKEPLFMFAHVTIWTGIICLALLFLGVSLPVWKVIFLFVFHYFSDHLKCKLLEPVYQKQYLDLWNQKGIPVYSKIDDSPSELGQYYLLRRMRILAYLDQLFHMFQIAIVYFL